MTHQTIKIGPCTVLHGNCLQALEDLPANFDALITDPATRAGEAREPWVLARDAAVIALLRFAKKKEKDETA